MGISLHRGPIAECGGELIYQGLGERDEESVSLCGSSVRGTWREGSSAADPEGYVK
jgi:hypothetical protein